MKPRPSLVVCLVLALLGWCLAGDVSGPEPRAATSNTAPVQMGAYAQPSALPSPVAAGKVDRITTDGEGNLWARLRGTIATSLASGNVTVSNITTGNVSVSNLPTKAYYSGSASSATDIIASTDASYYAQACLQLTGTWSGTVLIQQSNDNSTWVAGQVSPILGTAGPGTASATSNGLYTSPIFARYIKISCSSYSSGTIAANLTLTATPAMDTLLRGQQYIVPLNIHDAAISAQTATFRTSARSQNTLASAVSGDGDTVDLAATQQGQLRTITDINANSIGWDAFRTVALTNVSLQVKASAGLCGPLRVGNPNAVPVYLHVYNTANASVTVGTTTPLCTYYIPANGTIETPGPIMHSTAITLATTNSTTDDEAASINLTVSGGYK